MNELIEALVLFLPAGIANMTPPIANKIPWVNQWQTPMDFDRTYKGVRIFGDHKSWRGFVSGTICGTLAGALLYALHYHTEYSAWFILFSAALSAGALVGDAVKSFFKRRTDIKPGGTWFPFDQLDFIISALIFAIPFKILTLPMAGSIIAVYFFSNIIITYISYKLGFKDAPI
jgi:CDP-2,3-bis-(O-geranylgeranyl)-sn-glycerol synthase